MEQVVKYIFLGIALLSPLEFFIGLYFWRLAAQAISKQNVRRASEYKTRSYWRFITAVTDAVAGVLGYYFLSRQVLPGVDAALLFFLLLPSAAIHIYFSLRLQRIKET